jgi:hypothetical protein
VGKAAILPQSSKAEENAGQNAKSPASRAY